MAGPEEAHGRVLHRNPIARDREGPGPEPVVERVVVRAVLDHQPPAPVHVVEQSRLQDPQARPRVVGPHAGHDAVEARQHDDILRYRSISGQEMRGFSQRRIPDQVSDYRSRAHRKIIPPSRTWPDFVVDRHQFPSALPHDTRATAPRSHTGLAPQRVRPSAIRSSRSLCSAASPRPLRR